MMGQTRDFSGNFGIKPLVDLISWLLYIRENTWESRAVQLIRHLDSLVQFRSRG
jgi:hypothetical protein